MDADSALNGGDANAAMNPSPIPMPDMSGVNAARARMQSTVNTEQKQMQPFVQQAQNLAATPHPAQPNLQKQPAAPKGDDYTKDSQAWVGALAALSALVGARGRARGTGALKAYAAGLKGIQAGNQQAFENAMKTWDAESKAVVDDNKAELDKYTAVMEDRNLSVNEAQNAMKMIAAEHQDPLMLEGKDLDMQYKLVDLRQAQLFKFQEQQEKQKEKAQQLKESLWTPEEQKQYADQWNAGDKAGVIAAARASGGAGAMNINQIKKMAADENIANGITGEMQAHIDSQYVAERAGMSQAERTLQTRIVPAKIAVKEIDNLGKPMLDAIAKLDNKKYPDWNSIKNAYEKKTGDPNVVAAAMAVQEFKTAVGNLMVRNGAQTDSVRATQSELANINFNTSQAQALVNQAKLSGMKVLLSTNQAKAEIEGKPEPQDTAQSPGGIPAGAPTATGKDGKKMYWNGTAWVE